MSYKREVVARANSLWLSQCMNGIVNQGEFTQTFVDQSNFFY
jgi:hypothetical protein